MESQWKTTPACALGVLPIGVFVFLAVMRFYQMRMMVRIRWTQQRKGAKQMILCFSHLPLLFPCLVIYVLMFNNRNFKIKLIVHLYKCWNWNVIWTKNTKQNRNSKNCCNNLGAIKCCTNYEAMKHSILSMCTNCQFLERRETGLESDERFLLS